MSLEIGQTVHTPQSTGAVSPDVGPQIHTQSIDNSSTGAVSPGGPVTVIVPGFGNEETIAPAVVEAEQQPATTKVVKPKAKPAAKPGRKPAETK